MMRCACNARAMCLWHYWLLSPGDKALARRHAKVKATHA